jgi:cytochrome c5
MQSSALERGLRRLAPLLLAAAMVAAPARPQAALTPLPPGPETDRVKSRCTACHGLEFITRQPRGRGAAWWTKTIDDMADTHGADLSDEDRKAIARYLTRVND